VWEESDFIAGLQSKLGEQATQDLKVVKAWSSMVHSHNDDLFDEGKVAQDASRGARGEIVLPVPELSTNLVSLPKTRQSFRSARNETAPKQVRGKKRQRVEMLGCVPGCIVEDDEIASEIRDIAPKLRSLTEQNELQANQLKGL
jgi:hypothetical protein